MTITTGATARLSAEERRILIRYAAGDSPRQIAVDTGIPAGDVALTIDSVAKNNRGLARNIVKEYDDLRGVTAAPVRPAPKPVPKPAESTVKPVHDPRALGPDCYRCESGDSCDHHVTAEDYFAGAQAAEEWADARPEPARPVAEMKLATGPVRSADQVLTAAEQSGAPKLIRAADKIRKLLADLEVQVAEHQREAELRARVDKLAAELTAAREQLRSLGRQPLSPPATGAQVAQALAVDTKAIRAWAADNGVACPARGRIPTVVLTAWQEAQR
jgi:hypothetical protein